MNVIRYRTGRAIRWLETAAAEGRRTAQKKGSNLNPQINAQILGANVKAAAEATVGYVKSAWADRVHNAADEIEYVLLESSLELHGSGPAKTYSYADVDRIEQRGDRYTFFLSNSRSFTIKPHAYITAPRIKVPIGWERNGIEVSFETLIEELSARCGVNVVEL